MSIVYGISNLNPVSFLHFFGHFAKKVNLKFVIEPSNCETKAKYAFFFSVESALAFVRKCASDKKVFTIVLFAPKFLLEQIKATIIDVGNNGHTNKEVSLLLKRKPNTRIFKETPTLNRYAHINELVEQSRTKESFMQSYNEFIYKFQHGLRESIRTNVLNFMIGKIGLETLNKRLAYVAPKRGDAKERFQATLNLIGSDNAIKLRTAIMEVKHEDSIEGIAKKYSLSPYDIRYFFKAANQSPNNSQASMSLSKKS